MLRVPPGWVQSAVGDSSEKSLDTTEPDEELLTPTWPAVSTRPNTPSPTTERPNSPSPNPQSVDHAWSPEEDTLWRLWEYGGALTLRTPEDTQTEFARAKSSDAAAIGAVAATGRVPSSRFDPVPSPRFGSQELQRKWVEAQLAAAKYPIYFSEAAGWPGHDLLRELQDAAGRARDGSFYVGATTDPLHRWQGAPCSSRGDAMVGHGEPGGGSRNVCHRTSGVRTGQSRRRAPHPPRAG